MNTEIIYHITNSPIQIKKRGLKPRENIPELPEDDQYIRNLAKQESLEYPIQRTKANFFFPNLECIPYDYSHVHIVAVDVSDINKSIYVADRDLRDDVIWNKSKQVAKEYIHSITEIQNISDSSHIDGTPEIIIHGSIDNGHIVAVERGEFLTDVLDSL